MRIGIGLSQEKDPAKAARAAAKEALKAVPRPDLAIAFGGITLNQKKVHKALCSVLNPKILTGCSSYAEITPAGVSKDSVAVLLMSFEGALSARFAQTTDETDKHETGEALGRACPQGAAESVGLVFTTVSSAEEAALLRGIADGAGPLPLFGGMGSGDYDKGSSHPRFWENYQYCGKTLARPGARLARLDLLGGTKVAFGFEHGWDTVAPPVTVTRSAGRDIFELDGMPIMDYYRQFIDKGADRDFFRLMVQRHAMALLLEGAYAGQSILKLPVRFDYEKGSIGFSPAEDFQGRRLQLIQASRRGVLDGARRAAEKCKMALNGARPDLVLMVSCCTRSAILHSRVELELDAVRSVFGRKVPVFGYYSGGEILPFLERYEDIVNPKKLFAGSFYHTATMGLLAFSFPKKPKVIGPKCLCRTDDPAHIKELLDCSELILEQNEIFLSNLSRKSYQDGEKLKKQNEVIHRYTPHEVWKEVGDQAAKGVFELENREFEGAFLFMDVKGFTAYSETRPAADVVAALNAVFDPATRIIYENGGDVDKYIGDCIFAAFKEPRDAAKAACEILKLFKPGMPFTVRIGLNAGKAIRANVGSLSRREYTFIGDAVNLTQRLESNATPGKILMGESVYEAAKDLFAAAEKKGLLVKGRAQAVVAYESGPA